jgi:hypothetical protein
MYRIATGPGWSSIGAPDAYSPRQELGYACHAGTCHNPQFGSVSAQGIGSLATLSHQHLSRSQNHAVCFLFGSLTGTYRIVGRVTASQIASASAASVLFRLT